MTKEILDPHLAHYGVPGMRWGKRKAIGADPRTGKRNKASALDWKPTSKGQAKNPSVLRNLALGGLGNSKTRYTNDAALAKRHKAGRQVVAGVLTSFGTSVVGKALQTSNNEGAQLVGSVISQIGGLTGTALGLTGMVTGIKATVEEQNSRNN